MSRQNATMTIKVNGEDRLIHYKKDKVNWIVTVLLLVAAVSFIFGPLYMAVVIAIKSPSDMVNVLAFPKAIQWSNFVDAWEMTKYPRKFRNTFFITAVNLVFTVFTNAMASYAIERNRKKGKLFNILYYYFISAMFIPFSVLMLPLVNEASKMHIDNVVGITFLYIVFGMPMNTFLYTGYIKSIPTALDEAALIDGAGPIKVFSTIMFPLLKPMTATVAILSVMWTWNDFLMPLVLLTDQEYQTLQLSQYIFQGQFNTQYNLAFASYMLVLLPVLAFYILCQKWIIAGVVSGSVKQ